MSQYFLKPYKCSNENITFELDLCNYAIKNDLKDTAGVDIFNLAAKSNLASLIEKASKLDAYKLKKFSVDLSTPSIVVKMVSIKKLYMMN